MEKGNYPAGPPPNYQQVSQEHFHHQPTAPSQTGLGAAVYVPQPIAAQQAANGQPWPQSAPTVVYVSSGSGFGPHPQRVICPICTADVLTMPEHTSGLFTYLMGGFLCLIGCWPCCVLPCFINSCMDVEHKCPSCNNKIGINKRI